MSVKIMGLVWDLDLPSNKKFVLLAYADHANHEGKNIFPAIATVAKKTGYHERSVQRITGELNTDGYLVDDGSGPVGTNRWYIPLSIGGDKIAPLTNHTGKGDIPLGDIPLGDKIAPEEKEPSNNHPYDRKKGIEEAKQRKAEQRAKRGDIFDLFADQGSNIQMIDDMRKRVDAATGLRLTREWDKKKGDWIGYEKTLIKREVETGQTIEMFMEWYNSNDFRRDNQRIWLKPDKIELLWGEAMTWHENGKESQEEDRPEYKRFVPEEGNYVPKPNTPLPAALRRKDAID